MGWKKEKSKFDWKINKEKLIFLFCSGLLLFVISLPNGNKAEKKPEKTPVEEAEAAIGGATAGKMLSYEEELEERIREILSRVEGVGTVDVMVVLKSSEEKVLRVDKNTSMSLTEEKEDGNASRSVQQQELSESTVLNGSGAGMGPIVEKEIKPEISGIVISADGGGSATIKAEISGAMEALFGLPAHKVKVMKRVEKH